jgi:hypothetical protein
MRPRHEDCATIRRRGRSRGGRSEAPNGGLNTLVESAQHREIDLSLTLASGNGRLYWRGGRWHKATADTRIPGFTSALTLPI